MTNCYQCDDTGKVAVPNGADDFDWEFCDCEAGRIAERTKDWPKATGESMEDMNRRIQNEVLASGASNLPPGYTQEELDNR